MSNKIRQKAQGNVYRLPSYEHVPHEQKRPNVPSVTPVRKCSVDLTEKSLTPLQPSELTRKPLQVQLQEKICTINQQKKELSQLQEQVAMMKEQLEVMTERCHDQQEQREMQETQIEELDQLVEGLSNQNRELAQNYKSLQQEYVREKQRLVQELSEQYDNEYRASVIQSSVDQSKIQNYEKSLLELKDQLDLYISESNKYNESCVKLALKNDSLTKENQQASPSPLIIPSSHKTAKVLPSKTTTTSKPTRNSTRKNLTKISSLARWSPKIKTTPKLTPSWKYHLYLRIPAKESLMAQMRKWSNEKNELLQKLDNYKDLEDQSRKLKQDNYELKKEVGEFSQKISQINQEFDKTRLSQPRLDYLLQENDSLHREKHKYIEELILLRSELTRLGQVVNDKQSKVKSLEAFVESIEHNENNQTMYYSIKESIGEKNPLIAEFEQLKKLIAQMEIGKNTFDLFQIKNQLQQVENLLIDNTSSIRSNSSSLKKNSEGKLQNQGNEEEVRRLNEELRKRRNRIDDLEEQVQKGRIQIEKDKIEVSRLKTQIEQREMRLKVQSEEITRLNEVVSQRTKEIEEWKNTVEKENQEEKQLIEARYSSRLKAMEHENISLRTENELMKEKKSPIIQDRSNLYYSFSKSNFKVEQPAQKMEPSPNKENKKI